MARNPSLTVQNERVKKKKATKKNLRLYLGLVTIGLALYVAGQAAPGLALTVEGLTSSHTALRVIRKLQNPFRTRNIVPYFRISLESFHKDEFLDKFRFDRRNIKKHLRYFVLVGVFQPIVEIRDREGKIVVRFDLDELYLISLYYLAVPIRLWDLQNFSGRHMSELSRGMQFFHRKLLGISRQFVQSRQQPWFTERIARKSRRAIKRKGCPLIDCIGFTDGTRRRICKPGICWIQTRMYSGHKRYHCMAYLGTNLANGMCLNMSGACEGRSHDAACAVSTDVYGTLQDLGTFNGLRGCYSTDSAFPSKWPLVPAYNPAVTNSQDEFNAKMHSFRITSEWLMNEQTSKWSSLDFKRRQKMLLSDCGVWYINCVWLSNLSNCARPNIISQYFECLPPTLEEYLNVPPNSLD